MGMGTGEYKYSIYPRARHLDFDDRPLAGRPPYGKENNWLLAICFNGYPVISVYFSVS